MRLRRLSLRVCARRTPSNLASVAIERMTSAQRLAWQVSESDQPISARIAGHRSHLMFVKHQGAAPRCSRAARRRPAWLDR